MKGTDADHGSQLLARGVDLGDGIGPQGVVTVARRKLLRHEQGFGTGSDQPLIGAEAGGLGLRFAQRENSDDPGAGGVVVLGDLDCQ